LAVVTRLWLLSNGERLSVEDTDSAERSTEGRREIPLTAESGLMNKGRGVAWHPPVSVWFSDPETKQEDASSTGTLEEVRKKFWFSSSPEK